MFQSSITSFHARSAISFLRAGVVNKAIRLSVFFLLGLLFGGLAVSSFAQNIPPTYGDWKHGYNGSTALYPSPTDAALALVSAVNAAQGTQHVFCSLVHDSDHQKGVVTAYQNCGNTQSRIWTVNRIKTCPEGYTLTGNECVPTAPSCPQGTQSSATFWNGCFDVDGLDNGCDAGSRLPYPASGVCNGECVVEITNWTSCQMPVGGGPITCTGSGTLTGAQCQPGDSYIPPSSQKCPTGYAIGTVNGVPGCYRTGTPSPATTTTTNTTGSGTTTTTTVKSDPNTNTKTTTTTTTNTTTGDQQTTTTTEPLDPSKPMTGKENKAPGQEPQKIDESGTPTDGSLSAQKADYEAKSNERKSLIDSMANQGNHGLTWDWQFELPSGSCSAYTFTIAGRSFTLDPCEKLVLIRDALGFLIYITTALALLSIATGQGREGK